MGFNSGFKGLISKSCIFQSIILWTTCVNILQYCRLVWLLFLKPGSGAWTSVDSSQVTWHSCTEVTTIQLYIHAECIPNWTSLIFLLVALESGFYFMDYTEDKLQTVACTVYYEVLVASTYFWMLTEWLLPPLRFLLYWETIVWTIYILWAIFCIVCILCNGKEITCELHYSWH